MKSTQRQQQHWATYQEEEAKHPPSPHLPPRRRFPVRRFKQQDEEQEGLAQVQK
jgi:hypothetical protein